MCGRYSLGLPLDQIQALHGYDVHIGEWVNREQFQPRHNIAPRSQAPVIRRRQAVAASENNQPQEDVVMHTMKWGVVPHWSKYETNDLNTINARCEAVVEGRGLWGSLRGRKRCVIPCQGYFEWLKKGKERLPYFTKREDGKLMLLAGLYDVVTLEGQTTPLHTFTIVTTDANKEFNWLHDRQPVILSTTEALMKWLDTSSQQWTPELTKIVQPYTDKISKLICFAVPKEVGKVGTESPTFIEPITERKDGIQAMFARQAASQLPESKIKKKRSISPESASSASHNASPSKKHKLGTEQRASATATQPEVMDLCDSEEDQTPGNTMQKLDAWEDTSCIEYVEQGGQSSAKMEQKAKGGQSHKSPKRAADKSKITSYFARP